MSNIPGKLIDSRKWSAEFDREGKLTAFVLEMLRRGDLQNKGSISERVREWLSAIHPEDAAAVEQYTAEVFSPRPEGTDYDFEYRLMTGSGYRLFHSYGHCSRRKDGSMIRCDGILFDIQDSLDVQEATFALEEKVRRERNDTIARMAGGISSYIVDLRTKRFRILKQNDYLARNYGDDESYDESIGRYISSDVLPADRARVAREISLSALSRGLAQTGEYRVRFRDISAGSPRWFEMRAVKLSEDEILYGFSDVDEHVAQRMAQSAVSADCFGIYLVDLENDYVRVVKEPDSFRIDPESTGNRYSSAVARYVAGLSEKSALAWKGLESTEGVKAFLRENSKREIVFESPYRGNRLVRAGCYRVGEDLSHACMIFADLDEAQSDRERLNEQIAAQNGRLEEQNELLKRNLEVIGGLASEYTALYHVDFEAKTFRNYIVTDRIADTKSNLRRFSSYADLYLNFVESDAVHPDFKQALRDFYGDDDAVRASFKGIKRKSIRFKRKYGDDYLWTELTVVKCEAAEEETRSVIIGFAERDAEIRGEQALASLFDVLSREIAPTEAIERLLALAGDFYGASRCYIFEYKENRELISNNYEWCAAGVKPVSSFLQNVPAEEIDGWVRRFRSQGAFAVDGDAAAEDRALLEVKGVGSLLAAPILNGDELVGFVGVDDPRKAQKNLSVLRNVAVIAYAEILKRKENDEEHVTLEKLADTFVSVYYADLADDRVHKWKNGMGCPGEPAEEERYSNFIGRYVRESVSDRERERCIEMTRPQYLMDRFRSTDRFSVDMTDTGMGYERNYVFDFVKVNEEGSKLVICCRDVSGTLAKEKAQKRQLEQARNAAEEANRSKTNFLFNMSHDIRTPMNAITGFTNMAIKRIDDREKTLDCLQKIRQSGNMLLSLINGVLAVSRIESGSVVLEEQFGDVFYSFANVESTMRALAEAKDIDISFEVSGIEDRFVICDFDRCMRIFINVISNAIKYTPEGGKISVSCRQVGKARDGYATFRYVVEDNGIGMSEDFRRHAFEQFSRENSATVSGVQGTGLGLAVVKSFVDALGGSIECESRQGVGTKFIITLPFKLQQGQRYTDPVNGEIITLSGVNERPEETDFRGKRVLLADDNELNREITADLLDEEGLVVEMAEDGEAAVEILREKGPDAFDFVLMDIQMPRMNGYEATGLIRKMYPDARLPIIAVSANAFAEDRAASLAAGMNDHVAKPIRVRELFHTLAKYL